MNGTADFFGIFLSFVVQGCDFAFIILFLFFLLLEYWLKYLWLILNFYCYNVLENGSKIHF